MTTIAEPATKRGRGQPSPIDKIADETGRTVGQALVDERRRGEYLIDCCAVVGGITPETARNWLRIAAKLRLANNGQTPTDDPNLTAHERACCDFSAAYMRATGEYVRETLALVDDLARGTRTTTKVREERTFPEGAPKEGIVVRRVSEMETHLPNGQMAIWRLATLHPDRFGKVIKIVEDPEAGLSEDEKADAVADSLEQWMEGARAGADAVRAQAVALLRRFGDDEQVRAFLANVEAAAAEQATP